EARRRGRRRGRRARREEAAIRSGALGDPSFSLRGRAACSLCPWDTGKLSVDTLPQRLADPLRESAGGIVSLLEVLRSPPRGEGGAARVAWQVLPAGRMHAIMFRLKRAFHRSLAHVRPLIGEFGLTPARFDMMKTIRDASSGGFIFQSFIRRALGVSAATVSRMLKSLEELGFVVRRQHS